MLIKTRQFFKDLFFVVKRKRQDELTKYFNSLQKTSKSLYNINLLAILLRSQIFFFVNDVLFFIRNKFVFINGITVNNGNTIIHNNCVVQLQVTPNYFLYCN